MVRSFSRSAGFAPCNRNARTIAACTLRFMPEFHDAAPVDWVPEGETATVEVDGRPVTLANAEGTFCAFPHECPHQATPLGGLSLQRGRLIRCPEHGSMFDVTTGQCVLPSQDGWTGELPLFATRVVDEVLQLSPTAG